MILLSLAVFGDIVRVLPKNKKQSWNFWFGGYDPLEKAFNHRSFTMAVYRLFKTGNIEKIVVGDKVRIRITPGGLKRLLSINLDLSKFSSKKWDGRWRVVIFDVSEKDKKRRDQLRQKIFHLGFGMLQESVWISPFPIETEIRDYFSRWRIRGEILVCRAQVLVGDQRDVAIRVWKLGQLNRKYRKLVDFWESFGRKKANKKSAFHFQRRFLELLMRDPFLPNELLPEGWLRENASKIYRRQVLPLLGRTTF